MRLYKHFFLVGLFIAMVNSANAGCPKSLDFDIKLLGEDKTVNLCENFLGKVI